MSDYDTPMRILTTFRFLVVGIVNLLPMIGVSSAARRQTLYDVAVEDPNLVILMRHRAILFGIVGALLGAALITYLGDAVEAAA